MKKKSFLLFLFLSLAISGFLFFNDAARIKIRYGLNCNIVDTCSGNSMETQMYYVDCNAVDGGTAYYLDNKYNVIGASGGFCTTKCSGEPEWKVCKSVIID